VRGADYDGFAAAYTAQNDSSLFNAHYNRPELLRLTGDVRGLRVLDAGCGAGRIMSDLRDRGARVSGFDLSPAMIEIARERLGAESDLRVADLGEPLPYSDNAFDVVIASLALHYVENWASTLAELRRVLVPSGRLLVSIIHPTVYAVVYHGAGYPARTPPEPRRPVVHLLPLLRPAGALTESATAEARQLAHHRVGEGRVQRLARVEAVRAEHLRPQGLTRLDPQRPWSSRQLFRRDRVESPSAPTEYVS